MQADANMLASLTPALALFERRRIRAKLTKSDTPKQSSMKKAKKCAKKKLFKNFQRSVSPI
jgi:hypothetical protein